MHLIVGLGNPGREYAGNRHNVGFHAVDALARIYGWQAAGNKFASLCFKGRIGNREIFALLPQTFMNRSGRAVGEAARFYKIPSERVIVLHDDLDLDLGRVRAKIGGGHGGHNGLRDIDQAIGQNYWRVRLGIGHPGRKEMVTSHVLSDFSTGEQADIETMIDAVAKAFPLMIDGLVPRFLQTLSPLSAGKPLV